MDKAADDAGMILTAVIAHTIENMVADIGAGAVGDLGFHPCCAAGFHHLPYRQCGEIGIRSVFDDFLVNRGVAFVVAGGRIIVAVDADAFERYRLAAAGLTDRDNGIRVHVLDQIRGGANGKPKFVHAHTVKGKGVSFMENQVSWHGAAPNEEQYNQGMSELREALDKTLDSTLDR